MKTYYELVNKYVSEYYSTLNHKNFMIEYETQLNTFKLYVSNLLDFHIIDIFYSGTDYIELRLFDFTVIYTFEYDENYILTYRNTVHADSTFEEIKKIYDRMEDIKTKLDTNIIEFKQRINMLYLYWKNYNNFDAAIYHFFSVDSKDLDYVERCLKLKLIELL